ncbi:Na+/H+ antiporter NhaA [Chitinophaga solisilvae]|uniref:Na(+)/H(+) antiporter NhaA n=1 Tax=Chitinophaga solisilvae TaxID=1233460 RepID=A0A3S1DT16_9BACT|nr:Na+/H+ antiporter NhaA [Chitinophaga solisilvae]NSL91138.1 Na+/H+ antiporter NhaA [Chitinophaga solisilvae]
MIRATFKTLLSPLHTFLKDSRAVGIVLIVCTLVSMILANSGVQEGYVAFWNTLFDPAGGHHYQYRALHLPNSYLLWINDGMMVLFFFLVGMEIKRELTVGELSSFRKSILPVLAAIGGMVFPALIFTLFNSGTPYAHGWGIPMATDIAFSLGILSLLGKRVPVGLKIFLMALAIIDDLGAILTIAVFYTPHLEVKYLLIGGAVFLIPVLLNLLKVKRLILYYIPGVVLWYCLFNSGVHATIAGVLLAFCIPQDKIADLVHDLHDPVNFIIMPVFALANTAIQLPSDIWGALHNNISYGIIAGLVLGKPLGIFVLSFTAVKLKLAALPSKSRWTQLFGVGIIAGIGFTMSIFISSLAYIEREYQIISIISVIAASLLAGILGYVFLRILKPVPIIKNEKLQ